jgi:hypothetical protein
VDAVRIEGGQKIAAVARALRHLGADRTIVKEMNKRIRSSAPAVRAAIRRNALKTLPRGGGLNKWVAAASIRVSVRRTERTAGVYIIVGRNSGTADAVRRSDIRKIDAGIVRAPLWGNRHRWYPHAVTPGFASNVVAGEAGDVFRADAVAAVDAAVEQVLHVL